MRLAFFGSPPFALATLERLLESEFVPDLVVTPPSRPTGRGRLIEVSSVRGVAEAAGIRVLQPETVKDEAFLAELKALEPEVFLVVSYGELLRQSFLDIASIVSLNVHPSLLPRHRGATPVPAAIRAGDNVTGVTIQRVVLELDAGDVLLAREVEILPGETSGELLGRLAHPSGDLVVEALGRVANGTATYTPQDLEHVTVCKRLAKADGRVDWTQSAREIDRHVRAMNPWPLAFTTLPGGAKLALHRVAVLPLLDLASEDAPPGTVLSGPSAKNRLIVLCGEGALDLTLLQAAGKRAMSAADYLRGTRLEERALLGGEA